MSIVRIVIIVRHTPLIILIDILSINCVIASIDQHSLTSVEYLFGSHPPPRFGHESPIVDRFFSFLQTEFRTFFVLK